MEYAGVSLIDQRDIFCYDGSDNRCRMFYEKDTFDFSTFSMVWHYISIGK